MAPATSWQPHQSLTVAPTNLKEAIDWVLRVTGKDGKKNTVQPPASTTSGPRKSTVLPVAPTLLYRLPVLPG
uniref:Variant erythrocyte surface antigen-beta subunit n=1 Tax=Babesia bovis TaxID=5865 RepID=S6BM12_BABBO|nr:variant erythrocyte surface antigen- beta subunit [Babesia bovis]